MPEVSCDLHAEHHQPVQTAAVELVGDHPREDLADRPPPDPHQLAERRLSHLPRRERGHVLEVAGIGAAGPGPRDHLRPVPAARATKPAVGVPFWGYAAWWVRQAMQQLVAELTRPMVLSDRALRHLAQLKRAHGEFVQQHGREPTAHELADATGLTGVQVDELLALERAPRSIEKPASGSEGEHGIFGELLVDPVAHDAYDQLVDHSEIEQVRALPGSLGDRERMILRARCGLDGPERSLREVGEQLGLTGERVRQIENRALGKLRSAAAQRPSGHTSTEGPLKG